MNARTIVVTALAILMFHIPSLADDTATNGWRGDGSGSYPSANIPTKWKTLWSTAMPNWSNSSPILVDDKLFVCSEPSTLICLDEKNGKILWSKSNSAKDAGAPAKPPKTHKVTGYSSSTPTSDGKGIYVVYGSGVAAAYELDGKRRWIKSIERTLQRNGWGHCASPVLAGGNLIVAVNNIVALDPKTGDQVWELKSSAKWGTPLATQIHGKDIIITPNGELIQAKDGKVLTKHKSSLEYNGVVIQDDIFYGFDGKSQAFAYKISKQFKLKQLWKTAVKKDRYYSSPIIHNSILFGLTRAGTLTAIDAASGNKLFEKNLEISTRRQECYPSLIIAGNNLIASNENGKTVIIKPGRKYSEIARTTLDPFRSSILIANNKMYLRCLNKFYCFGK